MYVKVRGADENRLPPQRLPHFYGTYYKSGLKSPPELIYDAIILSFYILSVFKILIYGSYLFSIVHMYTTRIILLCTCQEKTTNQQTTNHWKLGFTYIRSSKELIVKNLTLQQCVCEYTDLNV